MAIGASLVLFGAERVRLAWRMLLFTSDKEIFDAIVDATSGELLFRRSLVHDVAALVFENYPGAPSGGQVPTEFPAAWISGNARSSACARAFGPRGQLLLAQADRSGSGR